MLAINMEESREEVAAWLRQHPVTVPILVDPKGTVTNAYRVTATPTVFLVARDGRLVARGVGAKPWTGPAGRAVLEALLRD